MIVAVAFCPAPPVLVPQVAAGAAGELATLRLACDEAVARLLRARPDEVVLVGAGTRTRERPDGGTGSLRAYGVDLSVGAASTPGAPTDPLPLSLTIGTWLLERALGGSDARRGWVELADGASDAELTDLGHALAGRPARTALLVLGDGSAARDPRAPLAFAPAAVAWDDHVAAALAGADAVGLAGLDRGTAAALGASGAGPWRVAAEAVAHSPTESGSFTAAGADLLAYEAPYGVSYFVATWVPG